MNQLFLVLAVVLALAALCFAETFNECLSRAPFEVMMYNRSPSKIKKSNGGLSEESMFDGSPC